MCPCLTHLPMLCHTSHGARRLPCMSPALTQPPATGTSYPQHSLDECQHQGDDTQGQELLLEPEEQQQGSAGGERRQAVVDVLPGRRTRAQADATTLLIVAMVDVLTTCLDLGL